MDLSNWPLRSDPVDRGYFKLPPKYQQKSYNSKRPKEIQGSKHLYIEAGS
jgi:hypothetical protein